MLTSLLHDILILLTDSISDIGVCAISPISGGNDSRKRQEKRLIFKSLLLNFIPHFASPNHSLSPWG